jgi:hypothetical protein
MSNPWRQKSSRNRLVAGVVDIVNGQRCHFERALVFFGVNGDSAKMAPCVRAAKRKVKQECQAEQHVVNRRGLASGSDFLHSAGCSPQEIRAAVFLTENVDVKKLEFTRSA